MADFKTHFGCGCAFGVGASATAVVSGAVPADPGFLVLPFVAAVVGAVAPDIDSDTSVPFHVTFLIVSAAAGSVALLYVLENYPGQWLIILTVPAVAALFVWAVIGRIFKALTHHRGVVHSVPFAVLASLVAFLAGESIELTEWRSFLVALAFGLGYLLHLLLDEIYSAISFSGLRFKPKRSLGSALKFWSHNRCVTCSVYAGVIVLLILNQARLSVLFERVFGLV